MVHARLVVLGVVLGAVACSGSSSGEGSSGDANGANGSTAAVTYEAPAGQTCVQPGAYAWTVEVVPSDGVAKTCAVGGMIAGMYEKLQPSIAEGDEQLEKKECTGTTVAPNTCAVTGARCNWQRTMHSVAGGGQLVVDDVMTVQVTSETSVRVSGKTIFQDPDGSNVRSCTWSASGTRK